MLNFDEQTGIGVLMIVWSFLHAMPFLVAIKTITFIIPTYDPTLFTNNDTLSQLPLSLSPQETCIHTYDRTIHLSIYHYLYIFAYQQAHPATMSNLLSKTSYLCQDDASILPCCMIAVWVNSASILECESSYQQGLSLEIFELVSLPF